MAPGPLHVTPAPVVGGVEGASVPPPGHVLCPAPFMVMDFAPEGNVHACCVNAAHPLGNVRFQTLREIWDGPRAQALRRAMERDDFGYGCGSCRHRLERGTGEADLEYYRRNPEPRDTRWPELMAFGLHNTCNLACVMCGGNLSSRLRVLEGRPRLEPAYGERFFTELAEFLPHLRRAEFRGGEPFLVREHFRIWELIVALDLDLEVQVTTNGTVWNERVERVLDAIPMQITFSMDGVSAATNEAIRVGTDQAEVLANLGRFAAHARDRGTRLDLSFCVLRQNWTELTGLLALADRLGVEAHPQLVLDPAHGLQRLPTPELSEVLDRLGDDLAGTAVDLPVNRAAGAKVLAWLSAELRQREQGHPLRLWEPPGPDTLAHSASTHALAAVVNPGAATVAERRSALAAWATDGQVGEIVTDAEDRVVEVDLDPVLPPGVAPLRDLAGTSFGEALEALAAAVGPHVWVVDEWAGPDAVDQTLLLAPSPLRDKAGLLVRLCSTPRPGGGVHTLAAADTYYWAGPPAP
ncbi:MAG: SPASM domain-containing protein [Acidimicrobiales bacterium]|nr:SPASM domain-containing protein [Acidimicrobiales bacterium]